MSVAAPSVYGPPLRCASSVRRGSRPSLRKQHSNAGIYLFFPFAIM